MAFNIVRLTLALGFISVVTGAQLFAGEPSCAETCYSEAVSLNGCPADDLSCQCTPVTQAGIAIAGGPCLLGSCAISDISNFSSAWTAACATATSHSSTTSTAAATATSDTEAGRTTSIPGVLQTAPVQQQVASAMGDAVEISLNPKQWGPAAVTAIAVSLLMMGIGFGVFVYCCSIMRKRRIERKYWQQLEREKSAMQASLDELKKAVSDQDTADKAKGKGGIRPKTVIVNWKEGPQELMVPEKVWYELPASPAAWEKM